MFNVLLGCWSAITCFGSPLWLTLVALNITGEIYKYDYSMDEGTAGIMGAGLLILWILFVAVPNGVFLKRMCVVGKKSLILAVLSMVVLCVLAIGMCGWDTVGYIIAS